MTAFAARVSETDCAGPSSPGRLLRRAEGLVTSLVERRFEGSGLSLRQWAAANVICNGTDVTPSDLARELGITSGAITRLVDELEGHGLIQRRRSGNDRRVIHLTITPLGGEAVSASRGVVADVWRQILSVIDERERRHLATALATLVTAAETLHTAMENTE